MPELIPGRETADWLTGGGEMGELIRAFDWSATPVGAIASWSPSLRTTVSLLLASRYPMTLIWGTELIQFYNDGYMQLLGSKHPSALGRPHRETFPEVLETVAPMIQSVITTGIPIWEPEQLLVLEREGYPEECYFTLSYSPVQDETGRIAGMLCVCSETTQKVLGERRLRLLRELAARGGEARTLDVARRDITTAIAQQPLDVPFALIYLREPDGRSLALYGTVGLAQGTAESPVRVSLEEPDADLWSLAQAASGETILIEGLEAHQLPGGSWSDPAHSALVLPIPSSNQEPPMGVLVAGISPRRALDEGYRSFFELLAGQVSIAIANAQAYEQERKRTEETISALNRDLQNRVNELQTLFDVVPIGILITNDLEFRHIKANPAFAKILGISPEANASSTPVNSSSCPSYKVFRQGKEITPDETPLRYAAIHGVTLEGAEVDIVRGDGAVFNLYGYTAPLLDEQGNSRGAVGAFLDISDRKRTEAALRLSQERYRSLAESLPQLLCMADADGMTQYCNQSWINYTGLTLKQTQGTGWQQAIHPDDLPLVVERWTVRETSNDYSIELRVRRVDGVYRWHLGRIVPIKTEEDKIVGWLGTAADIDDRKRTEQAVPLAEAVRTGEPIWEESTQERIARYPHLAQNYAELNYAAWISLPLMVEGRAVGGISLNFAEFSPLSEDERTFMLALAQQCAQAIARSQLYEAEQRARADAEAANRIKDEFLAVLSHELRSPLNPILGWTRLLRTRKFDEQATNRALETIERNATLQTKLIEDLLDVSRILRGKMVLSVSPVNLATIIESALETVRLAAESKGIQIKTSLAPNLGFVSADSARLQQVVWNLLSNAVKFTPSGGWVEVRVEQDAWGTQIRVSDTGKGINPEFLPYVFERFRQEDSRTTRNFGGLGLGLAIVRHLVELHGGTVQAESLGEGQGATFIVKLPLTKIGKEPDFESESQLITVNLNQLRILVVDDEADMRELLVAILLEYGAQVSVAASAAEALILLDQFKPDVLISDIGMPEVDGYMLMQQVRQLPPQQGGFVQAIALTAYAGELNQQQALKAGFQKHVTKPVEPDELVKTIAALVGIRL